MYSREASLPQEYIPEISAAVEKVGLKWDQFKVTDNSCPPHPPQESLVAQVRLHYNANPVVLVVASEYHC